MGVYLARRAALGLVTLFAVSLFVFIALRVAPGDPVLATLAAAPGEGGLTPEQLAETREAMGLNRPYPEQYGSWLYGMVRLRPGRSLASGGDVWEEVRAGLPVTLELAAGAVALLSLGGVALGAVAASRRGGWPDFLAQGFAISGLAAPAFWVGLLLILFLSSRFHYFPPLGYTPVWDDPLRNAGQFWLPVLVLAWRPLGLVTRVTRTAMLDALGRDFVRTARAKGLGEATVVRRHVLRYAALPVVTVVGAQTVFLLSGAVIIEQVFNLPGLGRALASGVFARDYPMVQFLVMVFAAVAVLANLLTDIAYAWLDPRVRLFDRG